MKLIQYQKQGSKLPELPNRLGGKTGYLLLALVQDSSEIYVAFTNYEQEELWIERFRAPSLLGRMLAVEELERIEDEAEFRAVRDFLIKKQII